MKDLSLEEEAVKRYKGMVEIKKCLNAFVVYPASILERRLERKNKLVEVARGMVGGMDSELLRKQLNEIGELDEQINAKMRFSYDSTKMRKFEWVYDHGTGTDRVIEMEYTLLGPFYRCPVLPKDKEPRSAEQLELPLGYTKLDYAILAYSKAADLDEQLSGISKASSLKMEDPLQKAKVNLVRLVRQSEETNCPTVKNAVASIEERIRELGYL